jgi:hypothetical protein
MNRFKKEFIDDIMFLYDEERQPISQIAYIMGCSVDKVNEVICSEIAKSVSEVV